MLPGEDLARNDEGHQDLQRIYGADEVAAAQVRLNT